MVLADSRRRARDQASLAVIVCDACGTVTEMDLTMKRRHPDAPISVVLYDARCNGRPRITALARRPSRSGAYSSVDAPRDASGF